MRFFNSAAFYQIINKFIGDSFKGSSFLTLFLYTMVWLPWMHARGYSPPTNTA